MSDDAATVETPPAKPRLWLRRLRIAVSVFFGVLAVALALLWIRSRNVVDVAGISPISGYWLVIASSTREIELTVLNGGPAGPTADWYDYQSLDLTNTFDRIHEPRPKFKWVQTARELRIAAPTFVVVVAGALCAGIPWIPFRQNFSLRALLIATTLLAVVLGFAAWMVR